MPREGRSTDVAANAAVAGARALGDPWLLDSESGERSMHAGSWYSKFAKHASRFCGRPHVFTAAIAIIAIWAISGPLFSFSDTWQLVINTATTIVTFLMVFLIQNTQNRDTEAIQVKLDELIRATKGAHNALLDLEELDDDEVDKFRAKYQLLAEAARHGKRKEIDID
jgi:low affinity Fe/Cu permease